MKKSKIIVLALMCLLLAGAILFTNEKLFKADVTEDTIIVEGVYIGGIDVSGMTAKQATDAVNAYVNGIKTENITLKGPNGEITVTYEDFGFTADVDKAVAKAVRIAQFGNLIQRFMNQKDLEKDNLVISLEIAIDKQVMGRLLHQNLETLNHEVVDGTITRVGGKFEFTPGIDGNEIDIVDSVNRLYDMIIDEFEYEYPQDMVFELTSAVTPAKGTAEEFAKVKDCIGWFSTYYLGTEAGRNQNVETGCAKINGTVVFPGEEISAYELTGPYTIENDYSIGFSYLNGQVVESIGGGICQVATTLYNAALMAELEITQRAPHSMTVAYVPVSADAAIATGYKDLKFKNNTETPIYIEGKCVEGVLSFLIYGEETRPDNRVIRYENNILTTNDPVGTYKLDKNVPVGAMRLDNTEHIGYTAELWKIVEVDGVEVERTRVNKSSYRASAAEGVIGIKGATAEEMKIINDVLATKDDILIRDTILALRAPVVEEPENPTGNPEGTTPGEGNTTGDGTTSGDGTSTGEGTPSDAPSGNENESNTGNENATGDNGTVGEEQSDGGEN